MHFFTGYRKFLSQKNWSKNALGPAVLCSNENRRITRMTRRNPTKPDTPDWTLSLQQETAVDLLTTGKAITDTAMAIKVTRQTVSEWVNHHPGFQAAVNARRQELWHGMTDTLRGLLPKALDVLARELDGETPLPAAVHVLKACGLYGMLPPRGPVDSEDIAIAEQQRAKDRRQAALLASY
jgi:hypothetical protein